MVNIKVPIGKRFEERERFLEKQMVNNQDNSDLAFLKNRLDKGRLITDSQGALTADGTAAIITPPNGSTFYFLNGTFSSAGGLGTKTITLENNGAIKETINIAASQTTNGNFLTPLDALIGDGTVAYTVEVDFTGGATGSVTCSITGYFENTEDFRSGR